MPDTAKADIECLTTKSMQAALDRAVGSIERPVPVLLMQGANDPAWWDVSLDQGLTWRFFATDNTPDASLADRFKTVVSGQWDHATTDDWLDEETSEPKIDAAERQAREERGRREHQRTLEREASIAPAVTGFRRNEYLANHVRVRQLLVRLDDLSTHLAAGWALDKQILQAVCDASEDLKPPVLSDHVTSALDATELAMCPFYAGFLWVGCDGPAVIAQRLDLCVRRARAALLAWLISGAANIFASKSLVNQADGGVVPHIAVLELVLDRVSEWAARDDALRDWGRAATYLRRQIRKLDGLSAAPAHKSPDPLAHAACKFLARSETGFQALHESAYSACST